MESRDLSFNVQTYRQMLKQVSSARNFITYDRATSTENFVIWRHDCDMSLNRARSIAEIDAENSIQATFFIHPHSHFYSVLEESQVLLVREIAKMGHQIGLHFDNSYHQKTAPSRSFEDSLKWDAQLLADVSQIQPTVFSFHNPDQDVLQLQEFEYVGLINTYSRWMLGNVTYASDSNGYWRHTPIWEVLDNHQNSKVQILTHPEWWIEQDALPRDRVLRCVYGRALLNVKEYDEAMGRQSNRRNDGATYRNMFEDVARAIELVGGNEPDS